jgi:citrate lyase subunit alpha/citrate CoA-transferase
VRRNPGESKILPSLRAAIEKSGLRDGMTIATHHHLRNGDVLLNLIVEELDAMGFRDICVASSSVHPVHAEMIPAIRKGVVTRCETGVNGLIGERSWSARTAGARACW